MLLVLLVGTLQLETVLEKETPFAAAWEVCCWSTSCSCCHHCCCHTNMLCCVTCAKPCFNSHWHNSLVLTHCVL